MTVKQKILKSIYPLIMWLGKKTGAKLGKQANSQHVVPPVSFYSLHVQLNNGQPLQLEALKGKKVLLVNTASECGYTGQYDELQKLYKANGDRLAIIGFPANDFQAQEKGSDEDIAQFCQVNYGVTFPLAKKSVVIKSPVQNDIFRWLTDAAKNGWNSTVPEWNFSKYLVDEQGVLTHYFGPSVSPLSDEVKNSL